MVATIKVPTFVWWSRCQHPCGREHRLWIHSLVFEPSKPVAKCTALLSFFTVKFWFTLSKFCCPIDESYLILPISRATSKRGGKQWQTTPKNLPRMQRTRAIPFAWLSSGLRPNWSKGWRSIIIIIIIILIIISRAIDTHEFITNKFHLPMNRDLLLHVSAITAIIRYNFNIIKKSVHILPYKTWAF